MHRAKQHDSTSGSIRRASKRTQGRDTGRDKGTGTNLLLPRIFQLHQPHNSSNPPHLHPQLNTNHPNALLLLHHPPINLPPHILPQNRLAHEIRIQRERPLRKLLALRVLSSQFLNIRHVLRDPRLMVPQSSAFTVQPFEHLAAEPCLCHRCCCKPSAAAVALALALALAL